MNSLLNFLHKPYSLLALVLALCPTYLCAVEALIPTGFKVERYEPIWKKSPFTLSSITTTAPSTAAATLMLTGVLKIGEESYVSVFNKETKERMFLSSKPNIQNIKVERIETGTNLTQVVVTLKKDGEIFNLSYDQNYLNQNNAFPSQLNPNNLIKTIQPNQIIQTNQSNQQAPTTTAPPIRRRVIVPAQPPR